MVVIDPLKNTPTVDNSTVGTNSNVALEPTQAEYQKLIGAGLTPEQIKANYANVMKKSADIDAGLIPKPTITPKKVESLASVDTKIAPTSTQNNQVAQSSTQQSKSTTLDPNKNDSEDRQAQILANLKNFEVTTPEIFNNKAQYDQVVGRANKSPLQQQIVDNYFNSVKATKEKVAAVDKTKVELSSMSDNILGYLNPTADQLNVINNDPVLLARYTQATMNRNILDGIQNSFKPKDTSNVLDGLDGIAGNLSQEVLNQNQKITEMKGAYDKASIDFNNIESRVRSEAEGTGISEGAILAKINKEKALAKVNLDKLATDYNTELGTATNLAAQVTQTAAETKAQQETLDSLITSYNSFFGDATQRNGVGKFTTAQTADPMGRGFVVTTTNNQTGEVTSQLMGFDGNPIGGSSPSNNTNNTNIPTTAGNGNATRTGMTDYGLRNNNPGNIKDTTFGNVLGSDNKGFAQFATPEEGVDALVAKIKFNQTNSKSKYYGNTIAEYFAKYAPLSDGNDPKGYAHQVANVLGVTVDTKISGLDPIKFAAAIAKHDSGYNYSTYGKGPSQDNPVGYDPNKASLYDKYLSNTADIPDIKTLVQLGYNPSTALKDFISESSNYKLTKSDGSLVGEKGYNPELFGLYNKAIQGKLTKVDYEQGGGKDAINKQAYLWFNDFVNDKFTNAGVTVSSSFLQQYGLKSEAAREKDNMAFGDVSKVIAESDSILDYLELNGIPNITNITEMNKYLGKIRSLQMSAKSENIFNLGVLNGPDLDVLNDILPASYRSVGILSDEELKEKIIDYRNTMLLKFNSSNKGLTFNYKGKYTPGMYDNSYKTTPTDSVLEKNKKALFGTGN